LEVAGPEERRAPTVGSGADAEVTWLERGGDPPGRSGLLAEAATTAVLPGDRVHAYLAAELGVVAAARAALAARGLTPDRLSAKPYWRLGVANAAHGEPTGG
jgi:NADPH-dependent ferric siderophore reductase